MHFKCKIYVKIFFLFYRCSCATILSNLDDLYNYAYNYEEEYYLRQKIGENVVILLNDSLNIAVDNRIVLIGKILHKFCVNDVVQTICKFLGIRYIDVSSNDCVSTLEDICHKNEKSYDTNIKIIEKNMNDLRINPIIHLLIQYQTGYHR